VHGLGVVLPHCDVLLLFFAGIAAMLSRLVPTFKFLHNYFGLSYIMFLLINVGSSLVIQVCHQPFWFRSSGSLGARVGLDFHHRAQKTISEQASGAGRRETASGARIGQALAAGGHGQGDAGDLARTDLEAALIQLEDSAWRLHVYFVVSVFVFYVVVFKSLSF
jgi:hypothetical protein